MMASRCRPRSLLERRSLPPVCLLSRIGLRDEPGGRLFLSMPRIRESADGARDRTDESTAGGALGSDPAGSIESP